MIRTLITLSVVCAAAWAMTTTTDAMTSAMPDATTAMMNVKILYDMKHHKAMIVRDDGCYEYHMNHQDVLDIGSAALEARMLSELAAATTIQETGHHHIDHMSQEITTACASVPVYSFSL